MGWGVGWGGDHHVGWKDRDLEEEEDLEPNSKPLKFHLHFFICKTATPLYESREGNLYESICKAEKAVFA